MLKTRSGKRARFGFLAALGLGVLGLAAGVVGLGPQSPRVEAYQLSGQRWPGGSAPVNQSDPSWPSAWQSGTGGATGAWSSAGADFRFISDSSSPTGTLSTSNQGNSGTLATSTWWYDGSSSIIKAQTVVNTYYRFNPSNPFDPGSSSGAYDQQSVMAHELGHWLSLGHSTSLNSDGSRPVMYASFGSGEVRTVGSDDAAGIRAIYGASTAPTNTPVTQPTLTPPTSTPTPTPTPFFFATPTATPVFFATATPTPTSTPTPVSTSGPNPTPTPTLVPGSPAWWDWVRKQFPGVPAQPAVGVGNALVEQSVDSLTTDPAVARIVVGRVKEVRPSQFTSGRSAIITDTVVDVTEHLLSGTPAESRMVVRGLGGKVGNLTMVAEDFPSFQVGETVLLFLTREGRLVPLDGQTFTVRGLIQGAYQLRQGQAISPLPQRSQSLAGLRAEIERAKQRR